MSSSHEISLLPKEEFERKALGRFLIWVLSVGRWIVVFTEFIVICAFLSRFYLDRRIADLHDDIFQKQAIVKAMSSFEEEFRFLQVRIETIEELTSQSTPSEVLEAIISIVPPDVSLSSFDFEKGKVEVSAVALSYQGLASFYQLWDQLENFDNLRVTKIAKEENETGISFTIVANFTGFAQREKNAAQS